MSRPFRSNRPLQLLSAWLLVLWVVTAIGPLYPRDWFLENILVIVWVVLLAATYRRFQFSNFSYALFVIFLSMHLVGAHYTYTETPFGFWMQDWFGFERNHYDRLVHFAFGLLIACPFRELLMRRSGIKATWSYSLTVAIVLSFSSLYEVIEGMVAMIVSPDLGSAYLGTQGDEWDAQKDAFLAFAGSVIAMALVWLRINAVKLLDLLGG
ncbi:MAG: DUF2238 domain-containing protein [Gammaproteobacteria bacterium]|nr:DUF2238 domain-containing protein [Gammaproteobacteria bacterium]